MTGGGYSVDRFVERYDTFLIDQFGVLHNGYAPFPGAIESLHRLKKLGKSVLLLSNSGKRSHLNEARLSDLGFPADTYDHFLSSGEVAWHKLKYEYLGKSVASDAKCLLLARDKDRSAVDGLGLQHVDSGAEAEVILIAGSRGDEVELDYYRNLLTPAVKRKVPCLCTNPDMVMLTKKGLRFGAGKIAQLYDDLGGEVIWIGKPYREIYEAAYAALGSPDRSSICCIGDSVEHDVAGGGGAGFHTALVLKTGIHADATQDELEALFRKHNAYPDHILPDLDSV
ncbi:MAG: TIGR01459 family HAD-type hydrolase [Stappiaceae bacterium]